jgi:hypothetical protein
MKTWDELTREQKRKVLEKALENTIQDITEFPEVFPLHIQACARKASNIAERMKTPWFYGSILFHETGCKLSIYRETVTHLRDMCIFRESNEPNVITL